MRLRRRLSTVGAITVKLNCDGQSKLTNKAKEALLFE